MIAFMMAVVGGTVVSTSLIVIAYIEWRVYGFDGVVGPVKRFLSNRGIYG